MSGLYTSKATRMCLALIVAVWVFRAGAATYYVDAARPDDSGAGTSWAAAKKTIQAAVNLTAVDDTVMVTDGVYDSGGAVGGGVTNRVYISQAITVRAVSSDPSDTVILGAPDSVGGTASNGPSAIRCVYLAANATIAGFTITNGYTSATGKGGGVETFGGSIVSNCVITSCRAYDGGGVGGGGGGAHLGLLYDCIITNNVAEHYAGGVLAAQLLTNCIVSANISASRGGGVNDTSEIRNCTISENTTGSNGGGIYLGEVWDCVISGNACTAAEGGGMYGAVLYNCTVISNYARTQGGGCRGNASDCTISFNMAGGTGGGVYGGVVSNCIITCNRATAGGGSGSATLYDCTVSGNVTTNGQGGGTAGGSIVNCVIATNTSSYRAGGANSSILKNCLVWNNTALTGDGGGVYAAWLYNCTVSSNSSTLRGGGAYNSTLCNCIVWDNSCADGKDLKAPALVTNTCSSDGVTHGVDGNITNNPLFRNPVMDNLRLDPGSPCINSGNNVNAPTNVIPWDLDGFSRIDRTYGGIVDMGAYEFFPQGTLLFSF